MTLRRVLAAGSGIALVAAAVSLWSWSQHDRPKRRLSVAPEPEANVPAAPPVQIRPPDPGVEVVAVRPNVPAPAPAPTLTPEEERAERIALDERRAADVEAQFELDAPPVAESWRLRTDIDDVFESLAPRGVELENVDCHHRLCRVQLLFENAAADDDVLKDLFVRSSSPEISRYSAWAPTREYLADSRVRTILYIAREGGFEIID